MKRYTTADGLPANSVTNILEDDVRQPVADDQPGADEVRGGAVKVPERPAFVNFDIHDGLQGQQFARGACFRSQDGEMFFGGARGLNVFRPDEIRQEHHAAADRAHRPAALRSPAEGRRQGLAAHASPLRDRDDHALATDESMVTIEFAALNYLLPQKNQYAYMLDGFDRELERGGPAALRHLRQSLSRHVPLPRARRQQRRGLEREGRRAHDPSHAALLANRGGLRRARAGLLGGAIAFALYRRRVHSIEAAPAGAGDAGRQAHRRAASARSRSTRRPS